MKKFIPQPYKLFNKVQHYDWGTKNEEAFIPKFLGIIPESGKPYAELWIGAHFKAPSEIEIDGTKIPLNTVIENFPLECLGENTSKKFSGKLPFLLKILSADRALSIQTHPNKIQAEKLHASDKVNYPDDNHKPEIAIALDELKAIAGFKPANEIVKHLQSIPELTDHVGKEIVEKIFTENDPDKLKELLRDLYEIIIRGAGNKEKLSALISKIVSRLSQKKNITAEEEQFLIQHAIYGNDVGLISFFFFNLVQLKQGQAIFTDAGTPHAYLKGNIVECMANSDNVVRAGLTNKFKDIETLLDILNYDFNKYEILNENRSVNDVRFKSVASEFQITLFQKNSFYEEEFHSLGKPAIILITEGALEVQWGSEDALKIIKFNKGDSLFIPASLSKYTISTSMAKIFFVTVP